MDAVVEITGMAHGGDGVCRIDDRVCFVPCAIAGDKLRIVVERESRGVLWGSILNILEPSPDRVEAEVCDPCMGTCGVCAWRGFAYPAQAQWKQQIVVDSLQRLGRIQVETIEWVDSPDLRLGYRTRAEFHGDVENWGFFRRGTHDLQPIESCSLCHPHVNEALQQLKQVRLRDEVEITVNPEGEDVLVWTKTPHDRLKRAFPQYNCMRDGEDRAGFLFDGVPIVNGAFSQSSLLLNRLLVRTAQDMLGSAKSVLDLYCGNGNFTLGLADDVRVLGLDHSRAAVTAADAQERGEYRSGDEGDFAEAIREGEWDAVLLDPPRTGAKAIADALSDAKAAAIVYVSCDPATLARDLKTLTAAGWRMDRLAAVDMFPHTPHVESVCRLIR